MERFYKKDFLYKSVVGGRWGGRRSFAFVDSYTLTMVKNVLPEK
jgi:hypothetical protein